MCFIGVICLFWIVGIRCWLMWCWLNWVVFMYMMKVRLRLLWLMVSCVSLLRLVVSILVVWC